MSERIKQLAEQAVEETQLLMIMEYKNFESKLYEKFAELIVKECAELCEGEAIFAGSNGRKDASASNCSTIIRKHFGVEG